MSLRRLTLATVVVACATDPKATAPTAPTTLEVSRLGAGAHLTWKDNSADEDEFVVMRQRMGTDAAMKELARVPFNTVSFHDEPVTSGATYVYQVIATNAVGDTVSNSATFVAP